MTQFIGGAIPTQWTLANDNVLRRIGLRVEFGQGKGKGKGKGSFRSPWWPGGGGFVGDQGADISIGYAPNWDVPASTRGRNSRFGYSGITRDVFNSPLPGMTVKLFLTADDSKVTPDILSDATTGEYTISTPFYAAHWIKIEKAGSPNVQGVSVSNIFPNV